VASIAFLLHHEHPDAVELARRASAWLRQRDHEVRLPKADAELAGLGELACESDELTAGLDVAVSLGGDGTMLRTVDLVADDGVPVIGVNLGTLGYLTEVDPANALVALKRFLAGSYAISERMRLAVRVDAGSSHESWPALNEAVLGKTPTGQIANVEVSVDGELFTTYHADGVIVATPTGSTAYSFSARGPIVSPVLRCIALTPISPHMLFDRSLVLAEHEELDFVVCENRPVNLTVDGRELGVLGDGDRVQCRAAPDPVRLATLRPRDFHQILKSKFDLPDR
jgi:NAD+ kinase